MWKAKTTAGAWLLAQAIHPTAGASQLLAAAQTQTVVPALTGPDALRWRLFLVGLSFALVSILAQTLAPGSARQLLPIGLYYASGPHNAARSGRPGRPRVASSRRPAAAKEAS